MLCYHILSYNRADLLPRWVMAPHDTVAVANDLRRQLNFRTCGFPHSWPIDGEPVDDVVCLMFPWRSAIVTVGVQMWSVKWP